LCGGFVATAVALATNALHVLHWALSAAKHLFIPKLLHTHVISAISIAKALLPSRGLSPEKLRSMMKSRKGTTARCAGAISPQLPSSATAQIARSTVDLPGGNQ
jgi:hypothetical protein